jgi:uncharacterized protein YggE
MSIKIAAALLRLSAVLVLALPAGITAAADTPATPAETPARITASGTGEAVAPAARATLTLGIETQAPSAAEAGAAGAKLVQSVSAALHAAGLPTTDLKATHLVINPQWVYDDHTRQRRRTGFQADSTLVIDTTTLERLGAWVDAALGAGATNVSDPSFAPADETGLRHLAVSRAVQNAHGDAEVMASAAGGTLGALLQLGVGEGFAQPVPVMRSFAVARAVDAPPTNIVAGDIHLTATVTGVWRYLPGPAAPNH